MPIRVSRNAESHAVVGGELDLASAADLHRAIDHHDVSVIDMSDVTFLDAAALRVLIDVRQRRIADGATLRIASPSAAVCRVLTLVGLRDEFLGS